MTLATSLAALVSLVVGMTLVWGLSVARKDASIVDVFWGLAFILVSWVYASSVSTLGVRPVLVLVLVHLWGLRLALYVLWRGWGQGEDRRYRAMRERAGARFVWRSLFVVFWLQGAVAWVISFPLHAALTSPVPAGLTWLDGLGVALFLVGLGFETVGDWQLARFKSDPAHARTVCDEGLWRYTRHPNYFGEAVLWWGLACFALATPGAAWTMIGPLLITVLLLKVSGVSLLEQDLRETKPGYREYVARTNAFIPWVPKAAAGSTGEGNGLRTR